MTNKSEYITVEPVEGTFLPRRSPESGLSGFTGEIIDLLTGGKPGQAFTWGLNQSGYSTNPQALRAAYQAHPEAVDNYLQYVNLDKILGGLISPQAGKRFSASWTKKRLPALFAGIGLGAAGLLIFNHVKG